MENGKDHREGHGFDLQKSNLSRFLRASPATRALWPPATDVRQRVARSCAVALRLETDYY